MGSSPQVTKLLRVSVLILTPPSEAEPLETWGCFSFPAGLGLPLLPLVGGGGPGSAVGLEKRTRGGWKEISSSEG